jgi:hypothetical protein
MAEELNIKIIDRNNNLLLEKKVPKNMKVEELKKILLKESSKLSI